MATYDLSVQQRLMLDAALEAFKCRNMSQRDRDDIETLQLLFKLNLPTGKFGVRKVSEVRV